jgi:hypothetical protein
MVFRLSANSERTDRASAPRKPGRVAGGAARAAADQARSTRNRRSPRNGASARTGDLIQQPAKPIDTTLEELAGPYVPDIIHRWLNADGTWHFSNVQ